MRMLKNSRLQNQRKQERPRHTIDPLHEKYRILLLQFIHEAPLFSLDGSLKAIAPAHTMET